MLNPESQPTAPQTAELELVLRTAGLGCEGVRIPDGSPGSVLAVPFVLGPLRGTAHLLHEPAVQWGFRDGLTTTTWAIRVVPEGDPTVADLLEAFGYVVRLPAVETSYVREETP